MIDFCGEIFGFNKKENETVLQYIKRHLNNDHFYKVNDTATG